MLQMSQMTGGQLKAAAVLAACCALHPCQFRRAANHAAQAAAAHAAATSSNWTYEDLLRGEVSPAAAASAKLLSTAAAAQFPRKSGSGPQIQPTPVSLIDTLLSLPT